MSGWRGHGIGRGRRISTRNIRAGMAVPFTGSMTGMFVLRFVEVLVGPVDPEQLRQGENLRGEYKSILKGMFHRKSNLENPETITKGILSSLFLRRR